MWYVVIIGGMLFLCWALYMATKDEEDTIEEFLANWSLKDEDDEEDPDAGHFPRR